LGGGREMKITVVIPAYNEDQRVWGVVSPFLGKVDEIIVVDDGSDSKISKRAGVKVIRHATNKGKGESLKTGFLAAKNEIVAFFDADLVGLSFCHLEKMVKKLDGFDMVIGVFSLKLKGTNIANFAVPSISGQRIFYKKDAMLFFEKQEIKRYGIDKAMYDYYKDNGYKIKITILDNLTQEVKEEKFGFKEGVKLRTKMYRDILKKQ
jgi:glycosyltransferase involved in cell wall biosynthesis